MHTQIYMYRYHTNHMPSLPTKLMTHTWPSPTEAAVAEDHELFTDMAELNTFYSGQLTAGDLSLSSILRDNQTPVPRPHSSSSSSSSSDPMTSSSKHTSLPSTSGNTSDKDSVLSKTEMWEAKLKVSQLACALLCVYVYEWTLVIYYGCIIVRLCTWEIHSLVHTWLPTITVFILIH